MPKERWGTKVEKLGRQRGQQVLCSKDHKRTTALLFFSRRQTQSDPHQFNPPRPRSRRSVPVLLATSAPRRCHRGAPTPPTPAAAATVVSGGGTFSVWRWGRRDCCCGGAFPPAGALLAESFAVDGEDEIAALEAGLPERPLGCGGDHERGGDKAGVPPGVGRPEGGVSLRTSVVVHSMREVEAGNTRSNPGAASAEARSVNARKDKAKKTVYDNNTMTTNVEPINSLP